MQGSNFRTNAYAAISTISPSSAHAGLRSLRQLQTLASQYSFPSTQPPEMTIPRLPSQCNARTGVYIATLENAQHIMRFHFTHRSRWQYSVMNMTVRLSAHEKCMYCAWIVDLKLSLAPTH